MTHVIDFAIAVREKAMTWQVRRGTPLRFEQVTNGAIVTKHVISIPIDTNRQPLLANASDQSDMVEVALPGYSKCQNSREALVLDDGLAAWPSGAGDEGTEPISSLSIPVPKYWRNCSARLGGPYAAFDMQDG
ncbi:hypothetical protein PHYSODRAFT_294778 [Phytophthora sojae]|uniref:Uncharacterized protein n=1 Tax=Phytophthora sojae (strain P6497) TaxID=1094619 RepID=G4YL25_PHYSP|nr:hypothetical protein PHYSODRAFT_294778 [Phytophthora sojae]EGZ29780.1 hypothetical protein PHYSODRAFT_294778 [Phytophthora sojae]|eukprot:XP_009517055.1 hypothetical protein PHYSODRAFT_294778 [Phytophthora sojae]